MLEDCPNDSDWCEDEIIADWLLKGQQMYQIRRGCKPTQSAGPCYEGDTGRVKFKDCAASCFESGCNKDLEAVGNKERFKLFLLKKCTSVWKRNHSTLRLVVYFPQKIHRSSKL